MSTLTVGSGQQFSTLAKAVAAARDGDTIAVQAGTYVNDFTTIAKDLTIEGVGGTARFIATVTPPNGKAIMVTKSDLTLRNLEFSGAKVRDDNGAGIRYEGGDLTVENSFFHHNQNGLLSNGDSDGTITIRNSEFAHNGAGDGQSHNLYVNRIDTLVVEESYFHDVNNGHHIKSRAASTVLTDNRVLDGANSTSSYNIDLPNGGRAVIDGNVLQQNAKSPNYAIVSYGAEGKHIAGSSLTMTDNLVVDDHGSRSVRLLVNRTSVEAKLSSTEVWGLTPEQIDIGPVDVSGTTYLSERPTLDTQSTWNDETTPLPPVAPEPRGIGTPRDDRLTGTGGDDVISGFAGDDTLDGAAGADRLVGGTGDDSYLVDARDDTVIERAGEGFDAVTSSASFVLDGSVEMLTLSGSEALSGTGSASGNRLHGNAAANVLRGLGGNDQLYGKPGDDRLEGGDGADLLRGGVGTDTLHGGAGADRFDWDSEAEAGSGGLADLVLDFVRGNDRIDLAGIDAISGTSGNDAFRFIGSELFSGEAGEVRFEPGESAGSPLLVQGDTDGDRIADFEVLIEGITSLEASDFVL